MKQYRFAPNWILITVLVVPVSVLVLLLIWAITYPAFHSAVDSPTFPTPWTWFTVFLGDSLVMFGGLLSISGVVLGFMTEITDTYIRRDVLYWHREIILADVRELRIQNYRLHLSDGEQVFKMSLLFYRRPAEVLDFIARHVRLQNAVPQ
jgi:hypothetical protein